MNDYEKTNVACTTIYDNTEDTFYYQCIKTTKRLNRVTRKWEIAKKEELSRISLVEKDNLVKELTIKLVIRRTATDSTTLRKISAFFVREVTLKIPKNKRSRHHYLRLHECKVNRKPKKSVFFISLANPRQQQRLTYSQDAEEKFPFVEFSFSEDIRIKGKVKSATAKVLALFREPNTINQLFEGSNVDSVLRVRVVPSKR